ncbi:MAG: DUF222 domain-containing protein [Nitriliruptoraceae bacterium]
MSVSEGSWCIEDVLDRTVTKACGNDLACLDEPALLRRIDRFARTQARLAAERARMVAELERRRTTQVDDPRDRERTRQQVRRELTERSNQLPSQAKLDAQAGAAARSHERLGGAFADGEILAEHVRLIASVLDTLPDDAERRRLEGELLEVARRSSPTVLGRRVREVLARLAPGSVTLREERQHRERRFTATETPDGGLALSGLLHGTAAETVRTALQAFRRPDVPGELRSPQQRGADAVEQLCAVALRAGEAPAQHGTRPQVLITVTAADLQLGDDGVATLASGETSTLGRLRHLLDDCSWARVILAPDGTPLEAAEGSRTVPAGLWRALLARDGGCTWPGCDAPAAWCDVAHGSVAFADGGRLSPDNAALLCRRHHRRFDHGGYRIRIEGRQVSYRRTFGDHGVGADPPPHASSGTDPRPTVSVGTDPPPTASAGTDPPPTASAGTDPPGRVSSGTDPRGSRSVGGATSRQVTPTLRPKRRSGGRDETRDERPLAPDASGRRSVPPAVATQPQLLGPSP